LALSGIANFILYENTYLDPTYPFTKGFETFQFDKKIKWDITGTVYKVGLLYQHKNIARFGLNIVLPSTFTISETYTEYATAKFATTPTKYYPWELTEKVKYSFTTPYKIIFGASTFQYNTLFSVDINYIDYTTLRIENKSGLAEKFIDDYNTNVTNLLRSVIDYNIGLEHHLYDYGLRLRIGYFTQTSAFNGDNSDFSKKYITFGFGYSISPYTSFDLGYAYGWWKDIGDNYGSNLSRNFQKITNKSLKMGISTRF